jgi:hypothetical protein
MYHDLYRDFSVGDFSDGPYILTVSIVETFGCLINRDRLRCSDFGTGIRRFESCRPSQHISLSGSERTFLAVPLPTAQHSRGFSCHDARSVSPFRTKRRLHTIVDR